MIVNADPRHDLILFSLESWSDDFHCTWPESEVVPPGRNTTFSIVHLGHALGRTEASITLNTSHGDLSYEVFADSSVHSMGVHPLINGEVPVNTTYIQPLVPHNPLGVPVQVQEIYSRCVPTLCCMALYSFPYPFRPTQRPGSQKNL